MVTALCWTIWRYRNDIIFNNIKYFLFMQATFRGLISYASSHSYSIITQQMIS
jgi:hypothetical protein